MLSRQSFEPGTLQFALRQLKTHLFLPVELKFVLQHWICSKTCLHSIRLHQYMTCIPRRAFCVVDLKFGRCSVSVWIGCLSVCLSVCHALHDRRLFGQLERRNCRGIEKKREKSSENEETVEKSREKWFGNGSVPNPSDYDNLAYGPIY